MDPRLVNAYKELLVTGTICIVALLTMGALLYGLYDMRVDNKLIFPILDKVIFGVFMALTGYFQGKNDKKGP